MTISDNSLPCSKPILSIQDLCYHVGGRTILSNIHLQVYEREFITFFGPNGGGKTTLIHLILGFLSPSKGKIALFDQSPVKSRRRVGFVPQNFKPDPLFPITVKDVVCLGNAYGQEALELVGMQKYAKALFSSLSGGEAAKVLLARALACKPQLLILDEPVANVDIKAKQKLYTLFHSLKEQMTILMVSHDLTGSIELSDRLYCIQQTIQEYLPNQLCHHFVQGLYHGDAK